MSDFCIALSSKIWMSPSDWFLLLMVCFISLSARWSFSLKIMRSVKTGSGGSNYSVGPFDETHKYLYVDWWRNVHRFEHEDHESFTKTIHRTEMWQLHRLLRTYSGRASVPRSFVRPLPQSDEKICPVRPTQSVLRVDENCQQNLRAHLGEIVDCASRNPMIRNK